MLRSRLLPWLLLLGCTSVPADVASPAASPVVEPSLHARLLDEQRQIIHTLAARHDAIHREIELTETGYTARTTSPDPVLVGLLKSHLAYMQARLAAGSSVRRWDPAFVEMVDHRDDIAIRVVELEDGVEVVVEGRTPEAVAVARNHGLIVTGFVARGPDEVQRAHAAVLER